MSDAPATAGTAENPLDRNINPPVSAAEVAQLHPQILRVIGPDFTTFCNGAEKTFRARSDKARQARNGLYAVGLFVLFGALVLKILTIDSIADAIGNWLLVIGGLLVLVLLVTGAIVDRQESEQRLEAAEITLTLLGARSGLTASKDGCGFGLEDHDGFASVLGGPFQPSR